MKPFTDAQRPELTANGERSTAGEEIDPRPVVKLFASDAGATWLLTELDASDPDRAFGLCDLGLGCPELGYVSLAELAAVRGRFGLAIERDLHFAADRPLSAYADAARSRGRIVTYRCALPARAEILRRRVFGGCARGGYRREGIRTIDTSAAQGSELDPISRGPTVARPPP